MSEPIRAIVITVSDRCAAGDSEDVSGKVLAGLLEGTGAEIYEKLTVTDDLEHLVEILTIHSKMADLIITTGGTGLSPRDNTPEATQRVIEREAPGLAEAMRYKTLEKTPFAMLSRGVCGVRGKCLIINLPGSPKGVEECFEVIKPVLQHAIDQIRGNTGH
ncbi:MAG TPA: MogA/MoaB family molybdenum cofactor biosynthesis protein [Pyrinomonadaceae bacterium]|jgi:molybdenum cofactor synthesis domain-containing protein|nr:MogA/MoaB family molybdenum cofactor biosynthesis protein [Pyrinomonadaceae bacterium]